MDQRLDRLRLPVSLSLAASLSLLSACGDDGTSDGSGATTDMASETSATASATDSDSQSSDSAETDSDSQSSDSETNSGDGDGDSGDGDGDSGDGDGDTDSGDGDGDPASGDGDGDTDSGDGDGDTDSGDGDGDSGGDGDGDSGDGDGDDTDMACQEFAGEVAPIPPSVMFLLDRSGSMTEAGFDMNDPGKTRWGALYAAVQGIVEDNDVQIAFGAKTFSTQGQGACGVSNLPDVAIDLNNAASILAGIPGPLEQVNGGTPTNLALEKTMTIMEFFDAGDSDKFIFLITDGRIGCIEEGEDQQALDDAVAVLEDGLSNHDITTYVVGIAPSQFGPVIDQLQGMAIAGGAPKPGLEAFYRADDANQLAIALDAVLQDSYGKSCLLNLEDPPFFPEYTKVVIGQSEYELVDNCDNEDGFVYSNMDNTQIQLCGQACDDLGIEQDAEVQFYCNPG